MTSADPPSPAPGRCRLCAVGRWVLLALALAGLIVLLMAYLSGRFQNKVGAQPAATPLERPVGAAPLVRARYLIQARIETAVGSIRPVAEAQVASKLLAKVLEVNVKAGQQVRQGEVLVRLYDDDLRSRRQQAQSALADAQAAHDQARTEARRVEQLLAQKAATSLEVERYQTTLKSAAARLQQAQQAVEEAQMVLAYATVTAPMDGVVVDKRINAGDTASPGQVLLTLYDPARLQLVASVRESLAQRLQVGQAINVRIDAMNKTCLGQVSEIVPEAQVASRSFAVKVTGPCQPGIYPGMFARLQIPLENEEILVIPAAAVMHVGQLDMVEVAVEGRLFRRAVTLGRTLEAGALVEVLTGLEEGEEVLAQVRPEVGRG